MYTVREYTSTEKPVEVPLTAERFKKDRSTSYVSLKQEAGLDESLVNPVNDG